MLRARHGNCGRRKHGIGQYLSTELQQEVENDVSDGEGTTFMEWRQRAQSETADERPRLKTLLLVAAAVVVLGVLTGVIVLMLS